MRSYSWLKGTNVIVSGVSSGMGKDVARILVKDLGCKVFGIARSIPKLDKLKEELGENFTYISMDISTKENWQKIYDKVVEIDFKPDVLINNAGVIHPFIKFMDLDEKELQKVIDTNFMSIIYSIRVMKPLLDKSPKKAIVNIASASAYLPVAGASVYSASKSAALSLTEVIKEELMGEGYYVGAVMPGPVKTDLYEVRGSEKNESKVKDNIIHNVGLSSFSAAKKIVRRISRCKTRITIGGPAALMSGFYRAMPSASLFILGKLLRIVPLNTYRDLFKDEKKK